MLTPQDIAEKPLNKVRFGGYDMGEVDDFLEQVGEDYSALYKENAILKSKLKVLVEKIEEYRTTEDSMRVALLTAQKVGENIKTDADKQREAVLRDANEAIKAKLAETAKRVADEELRLSVAAKETTKFIELSQAVMKRHAEFLTKLEGAIRVMDQNRPAPSEAATSATAPAQADVSAPAPMPTVAPTPPTPPTPPAPPIAPIVPIAAPAQAPAPAPAPGSEILQDQHILDVADQIDSAMQRITDSSPAAPMPAAPPVPMQASAPIAQSIPPMSVDSDVPPMFMQQAPPLYDPNTAPTTTFVPPGDLDETSPRPKFDFDDLRFGENF